MKILNIGIIVYSQTGNTYSVALKLKEKLITTGHSANIERLIPTVDVHPGVKNLQLKTRPKVDTYDALVFGSPVQGFTVSPAMISYLSQIASLKSKKVSCLVTQFFPFPWMGGNRAIARMKKICESKGAVVCGTGIVNWTGGRRDQKIIEVVDRLSVLF